MKCLFDLHTHTIASGHAYSTLQEMVSEAKDKEIQLLGISDHAPAMPGSAYIYHFHNTRVIPRNMQGVKLMIGVEANIISHNGKLDMSKEDLRNLDYTIASFHPPCIKSGSKKENTKALLKVMENPFVNIIGHPDDARFALDYEAIVLGAKENKVLLEVNNASLHPKGFRVDAKKNAEEIMSLCKKYNQPVIIGSDAHISCDIANFYYAEKLIEEMEFPEELIVNLSLEKLRGFMKKI